MKALKAFWINEGIEAATVWLSKMVSGILRMLKLLQWSAAISEFRESRALKDQKV